MDPDDLIAAWDLALAHHRAGQVQHAEACCMSILEAAADHPGALNLLGMISQQRGALSQSVVLLRRAVQADPRSAEAAANLAKVLRMTGAPSEARDMAQRAASLDPTLAEACTQVGLAMLALNEPAPAAEAFRQAAQLAPLMPETHVNLGTALTRLADFKGAAEAFRRALALEPRRLDALAGLGVALCRVGGHDEAVTVYQQALALSPDDVSVHIGLANAFIGGMKSVRAVGTLRAALTLAPDNPQLWTLLGSAYMSLGDFKQAAASHRHALELDPNAHESRRDLALLRQDDMPWEKINRLQQVLADPSVQVHQRSIAGFALGEQFDLRGDFDQAFASFAAANRLIRQQRIANGTGFDPADFDRAIREQIGRFPASLFAQGDVGSPSELPVFIVGMPRSGTSLVEQILSSHSMVFGAGERPDVERLIQAVGAEVNEDNRPGWRAERIRWHTQDHLARLQALCATATRVTDKLPDNIFYLGYIALFFPNSRVILCRRDPRDVGLSCFTKQFIETLTWANDLGDIAARIAGTERLMAHWREVVPLAMLEVTYETLVANLEEEARRMIEFLGLEWQASCLDFHQNTREVTTASRWQVRQPLYTTSVGRWRNYRQHLQPLIAGLEGLLPKEEWQGAL